MLPEAQREFVCVCVCIGESNHCHHLDIISKKWILIFHIMHLRAGKFGPAMKLRTFIRWVIVPATSISLACKWHSLWTQREWNCNARLYVMFCLWWMISYSHNVKTRTKQLFNNDHRKQGNNGSTFYKAHIWKSLSLSL